jgi:hypothetical protein
MIDSPTRNEGCGARTQALLDSLPEYTAQANTYRSAGAPPPRSVDREPAASIPPEAAGNPVEVIA